MHSCSHFCKSGSLEWYSYCQNSSLSFQRGRHFGLIYIHIVLRFTCLLEFVTQVLPCRSHCGEDHLWQLVPHVPFFTCHAPLSLSLLYLSCNPKSSSVARHHQIKYAPLLKTHHTTERMANMRKRPARREPNAGL